MKATSYQALTAKFQEILKESQAIQSEFKSAVKGKIARQAKMVDNTLTDQQVEEICNDPEVIIYTQSTTKETKHFDSHLREQQS